MSALLEIRNLKTYFYRRDGVVRAVDGISYEVGERESVGIVGESGSGKSVSMLSVVRLIGGSGKIEAGEVDFGDEICSNWMKGRFRKSAAATSGSSFRIPRLP